MPLEKVLTDWSDYDIRKSKNADPHYFSCEVGWEREYLKKKIVAIYPSKGDKQVLAAILTCCETLEGPLPRKIFVNQVLKKLDLVTPKLNWL
ncbi:MAG: hypothetical protein ACHQF2_03440 [Flavobacteriales bacterium]